MRSISWEEEDAEEREKYGNILEDKKDNPPHRKIPPEDHRRGIFRYFLSKADGGNPFVVVRA